MKKFVWLVVAAAVLLAFFLASRIQSSGRLNVEPHAGEEIEKAKHR